MTTNVRTPEQRERERLALAARRKREREAGLVRAQPVVDPDDYSHPESDVSRGH